MKHKFNPEDHILITLKNGTSYQGYVKSYSQVAERLTLKNIVQYPGQVSVRGCKHFEGNEIGNIKFLDRPEDEGVDENEFKHVFKKLSDEECNKISELQKSYQYLDGITKGFLALSHIKDSKIIGVYAKDVTDGRFRRASIIVISTEKEIFIFDLETIGDSIFDKGLRDILESESVVKVVYDCRLLSDCLYHKHKTKLANVRDVEAQDLIIFHQEHGSIRQYIRSLGYLVEFYLGIASENLDESHCTEPWSKRPLNVKNQDILAVHASFLIPLHKAIEKYYMQKLTDISNIYNIVVRDSDTYESTIMGPQYIPEKHVSDFLNYKTKCKATEKGQKKK